MAEFEFDILLEKLQDGLTHTETHGSPVPSEGRLTLIGRWADAAGQETMARLLWAAP